ncbi:hypothetical protein ACLMJK_001536 [Lecanora helva]
MSNRRRKSLSIFTPDVSPLTPLDEPKSAPSGGFLKKKRRPIPLSSSSPSSSPKTSPMPSPNPSTPIPIKRAESKSSVDRFLIKSRPKSLQKTGRPGSVFGSFRSLSTSQEEDNDLTRTSSTPTSIRSTYSAPDSAYGSNVLHHGEVQTSGGMFRKKSLYFVLTDTHLLRFKSQSRAAQLFPIIPSSMGKAAGMRHHRMSSMSSSGSLHELHTTSSTEGHHCVPLNHIVAVWRLEDGRPYFSIEIDYLDEDMNNAGGITLQLNDPRDYELWMSSIRGAVIKARLADPQLFSQGLIEYTCRALEQDKDYDPHHFHMFKVVQRAGKSSIRSSSEDLTKVTSNICILAIGIHKLHLLPLPKSSRNLSSASLSDFGGSSHGLMTLTHMNVHDHDDAFSLTFRLPYRRGSTLTLASSLVNDIALSVRHATDFLRPQWAEAPLTWNVPNSLDDQVWDISGSGEPYECYDRTLAAYCRGYGIDASKILYQVHDQCEDNPVFQLLPPADGSRTRYTALELLAIFRSLRYNESFATLSFRNISLDSLHSARDRFGDDHVPWTTKSGDPLNIPDQEKATLLVQEVRALAVKCRRLRRLDFSSCLSRGSRNDDENAQDSGSGICEALFPLCEKQRTNVDWINLSGIHLTDIDVDYLFSAAIDRSCHFRALEVGYCALVDRSMQTVLQAISHQAPTIESVDLSGNVARQEVSILEDNLAPLDFLRKLNLSNINRTSGPEPLIAMEVLCHWKLSELRLSRTSLNQASIDALAGYLLSEQSVYLRLLELDRCRLTGAQAALLLSAMSQGPGEPNVRNLQVNLSENQLGQQHEALIDAISHSHTPFHLIMQTVEYKSETTFRNILHAFAQNTTTKVLDISKASLQSDASDETCEALRLMFAENHTIRELNISGENSHLEAANYGSGLNQALVGLMYNETLSVLRIEHQKLGLQGANTLASVLGTNHALQEIYLENNEINLQAFTVLMNALEHNNTLLYLPSMDTDRAWTQQKLNKEIENIRDNSSNVSSSVAAMSTSTKATVNRTFGRTLGKTFPARSSDKIPPLLPKFSETDMTAVVGSLSQNWDREVARLHSYLQRNYKLLHGSPEYAETALEGPPALDVDRPGTSESLATALRRVQMEDVTPVAEVDRQLIVQNDFPDEESEAGYSMDEGEEDLDGDGLEMKEHFHV